MNGWNDSGQLPVLDAFAVCLLRALKLDGSFLLCPRYSSLRVPYSASGFLSLPLAFLPDHAVLLCDTRTPSVHADSIKDELDMDFLHSLMSVVFSHPRISPLTTSPASQLPLPSSRQQIWSVDTRLSLVLWTVQRRWESYRGWPWIVFNMSHNDIF